MKAKYETFVYDTGSDGYYMDNACKFMTEIGAERIIAITDIRDTLELMVIVWYWSEN